MINYKQNGGGFNFRYQSRRADSFLTPKVKLQFGFSLIELMIASLIGLITITGIISIFIASGKHYKLNQAQADVQQNGQFILRRLKRDVQSAGFNLDWEHVYPALTWLSTDTVNYPANATNILEIHLRNIDNNNIDRHSYYLIDDLLKLQITNDILGSSVNSTLDIAENIASLKYRFASNVHDEKALSDVDWLPRPGSGTGSAAYIEQSEFSTMVAAGDVAWHQVKAVAFDLVVASETKFITDSAQKLPYFDFNSAAAGALPSTLKAQDLRYFRGFKSTVALKNRIK